MTSRKKEIDAMMRIWPDIVKDLTETDELREIPESTKWMKEALNYLIPNDNLHRGMLVVDFYRKLASPDQLTDKNLKLARILAWCAELFEGFLVLQDDIMDQSAMRRGKPVWSVHSKIGLGAINDAVLLEQAAYQLLRQHFREQDCYMQLVETCHEVVMKTALGQTMDLLASMGNKRNFDLFTMDRFDACVKFKNVAGGAPIILAMYLAGINDVDLHKKVMALLLKIVHLHIAQNDYLDIYGDPNVTNKTANDIEMGKASWLAITALQRATPQQRKIFEACYGYADPEKVARVRELYEELKLPAAYASYEEDAYNSITADIEKLPDRLPRDLFHKFLQKVRRQDFLY